MSSPGGRPSSPADGEMDILYVTGTNYDYNYSMYDLLHPSSYERGFFTSANFGIFLCLCGIAFNLILITLILGSRSLRKRFVYIQILNVAVADLCFVVSVDCFTVYYDMHKWIFGVHFCKAWMILDVALPNVSIVAILLLNSDRILFMYKTKFHEAMMSLCLPRVFTLLFPWCISTSLVCSLWLGFSEVEPRPGVCLYGITKEANTASTWLTVFLPAIFIVVLVVFVFIAAFGDMPSQGGAVFHNGHHQAATRRRRNCVPVQRSPERSHTTLIPQRTEAYYSNPGQMRRVVVSILAVDIVSLFLTLPFTAFSHVSPMCKDRPSCDSLKTLFQALSWMRSSVACFRPLLFILLTEARFVCFREDEFGCRSRGRSSSDIRLDNISASHENISASHADTTNMPTDTLITWSQTGAEANNSTTNSGSS